MHSNLGDLDFIQAHYGFTFRNIQTKIELSKWSRRCDGELEVRLNLNAYNNETMQTNVPVILEFCNITSSTNYMTNSSWNR